MHWRVKVSGYGKIERAAVEPAPLTLFVGDNNSGKSYLLSLLWGIQNLGVEALLGKRVESEETEAERVLSDWMKKQIQIVCRQGSSQVCADEIAEVLQTVLNEGVQRNKDRLVEMIFNSPDVSMEELEIELKDLDEVTLHFTMSLDRWEGKTGLFEVKDDRGRGFITSYSKKERMEADRDFLVSVLHMIFSLVMDIEPMENGAVNTGIYLPAARTGFMLTKDLINKVGRNTVFNLGVKREEISPFTRPVNQFLDVMNDLTLQGRGREEYQEIIEELERGMAEGMIEFSGLPNREIAYVPAGQQKEIPLRVVSAVVTELSPLILILKHMRSFGMLFYEEPEICLHPHLQQKMAGVICRLVNARLNMVVTTHSDLILQHINNMICLPQRQDAEEICRRFDYVPGDLLEAKQVRVYQLTAKTEGKTVVEELTCGKYGFAIPTFNNALDRIMDEAYAIQE